MMATEQFERQTYDVPVAAKILGVGRNAMYGATKRGDVRAIQIGKRLVIPKSEIDRLLNAMAVPQTA
jgi:excisionase family DNA binding protein